MVQVDTRRPFLWVLVLLAGLAWAALAVWHLSPWAFLLGHEALAGHGEGAAVGGGALFALFVAGWVLMTVAMMLPTSAPLVLLFARITQARSASTGLLLLLLTGYLVVWAGFGAAAHLGDRALHAMVHRVPWLDENQWLISAGVLALAGAYQFSSLKYACLEACRSPMAFLMQHWHGGNGSRDALLLGIRHGAFCVGCCWALMLLMFAFSSGGLIWMVGMGALMAAEKNLPKWGPRLSAPLGVALLAAAVVVAARGIAEV